MPNALLESLTVRLRDWLMLFAVCCCSTTSPSDDEPAREAMAPPGSANRLKTRFVKFLRQLASWCDNN